jgi:hypothetical protein
MKLKLIKELSKDFKSANTWADNLTLNEFIKFLTEKDKIRKCGTSDNNGGMLPTLPFKKP